MLDPIRLETARLRRGFTQAYVAEELGVRTRTYRGYEQHGAPMKRRDQVAEILGYPASFFTRPDVPKVDPADVAFRAGKRAPASAKAAAVAAGRCGIELDAYLHERFNLPALDLPDLAGQEPAEVARLLRAQWGLGDKPLPNLIQLCESRGIHVYGLPASAFAVDAYSHWYEGVPYIFLARRRTPEGVRFDIAHELGHLVLHTHTEITGEQETEADLFASEFLLPSTALAAYLPRHPGMEDILQVRSAFRMSAMAVTVTANKAGWIGDNTYRRLCTALGKEGYRTAEPGGMTHYESSRVFNYAFSEGGLTPQAVAADLSLPLGDVHALTLSTTLHAV